MLQTFLITVSTAKVAALFPSSRSCTSRDLMIRAYTAACKGVGATKTTYSAAVKNKGQRGPC